MSRPKGVRGWWFPSILNEEEKEVYIPVPVSGYPTTLAVGVYAREKFPGYNLKMVSRENFVSMGGEL